MPELVGMLKCLNKDDVINGSSQMARAVWALGRLGKAASPAEIARTIRARTPLNWEGAQAAKFFRNVFNPIVGTVGGPWFIRCLVNPVGPGRPRYLYELTDSARVYFRKKWVEGDWKPGGAEERGRLGERVEKMFCNKDNTPEGKDKVIQALRLQVETLTHLMQDQRELLNRIHTLHHAGVKQVMSDIDTFLGLEKK